MKSKRGKDKKKKQDVAPPDIQPEQQQPEPQQIDAAALFNCADVMDPTSLFQNAAFEYEPTKQPVVTPAQQYMCAPMKTMGYTVEKHVSSSELDPNAIVQTTQHEAVVDESLPQINNNEVINSPVITIQTAPQMSPQLLTALTAIYQQLIPTSQAENESLTDYTAYLLQLARQHHLDPRLPTNASALKIFEKSDVFWLKTNQMVSLGDEVVPTALLVVGDWMKTYQFNPEAFNHDCQSYTCKNGRNELIYRTIDFSKAQAMTFYTGSYHQQLEYEKQNQVVSIGFARQFSYADVNNQHINNFFAPKQAISPMNTYQFMYQSGYKAQYKRVHQLFAITLVQFATESINIGKEFDPITFVNVLVRKLIFEHSRESRLIQRFYRQDILPCQTSFVLQVVGKTPLTLSDGFNVVRAVSNKCCFEIGAKYLISLPQYKGFAEPADFDFSQKQLDENALLLNPNCAIQTDAALGLYKSKLCLTLKPNVEFPIPHSVYMVIKLVIGQKSALALLKNTEHYLILKNTRQSNEISQLIEGKCCHLIGATIEKLNHFYKVFTCNRFAQASPFTSKIKSLSSVQMNIFKCIQIQIEECGTDYAVGFDEREGYVVKSEQDLDLKVGMVYKFVNVLVVDEIIKGKQMKWALLFEEGVVELQKGIRIERIK